MDQKDLLPKFFVPKSIYNEAMDDIDRKSKEKTNYWIRLNGKCHQTAYKNFNFRASTLNVGNILEAARQAFEDRNFKILYEIIFKGLDLRIKHLTEQLFEYLYAAIEIDPKISNRDEMLVNAVKGFKVLQSDQEAIKIIKKSHLLIKSNTETKTIEDSSNQKEKDVEIISDSSEE